MTALLLCGSCPFSPARQKTYKKAAVFGNFSRFIKPGAHRIPCSSSSDDLIATAFLNPDEKIAVVILNLEDADQEGQMWIEDKVIKFDAPARGVITIVFQPEQN